MVVPDVVLAAMAAWRVSHMLLHENGPFTVFRRLRERLGVTYYPDSNEVASYRYEITTCIWCLSVWVGGGIAALWWFAPHIAFWLCLPYALSAFVVLMHKLTTTKA